MVVHAAHGHRADGHLHEDGHLVLPHGPYASVVVTSFAYVANTRTVTVGYATTINPTSYVGPINFDLEIVLSVV
jgi:hypothetical protein